MSSPRIFQAESLTANDELKLDSEASHHVGRVLRMNVGEKIILFNGEGGEYETVITEINKKNVIVKIQKFIDKNVESPLNLYLAQGIARGEKMDYLIQKSVELGVKKIYPLLTERCNVKLDAQRMEKKLQHWGKIIVSACEQSGRNFIPEIFMPETVNHFLSHISADWKFVLSPTAEKKLTDFAIESSASIVLMIGPEGGLTDNEIELSEKQGFHAVSLGPRILRTETAAIAALSVMLLGKA